MECNNFLEFLGAVELCVGVGERDRESFSGVIVSMQLAKLVIWEGKQTLREKGEENWIRDETQEKICE